mgnify:CR=1 FL=1
MQEINVGLVLCFFSSFHFVSFGFNLQTTKTYLSIIYFTMEVFNINVREVHQHG